MNTQKGTYFEETQYSDSAWVWLIILALQTVVFSFLIFNFDTNEINKFSIRQYYIMWGIFSLMFLAIYILFKTMYLYLGIDNRGINYQYKPFMKSVISIQTADIQSYSVREYSALKEFGGRGFKPNTKKENAPAYTMKGKYGIELKLSSGKTIFIGTQRKEALEYAMQKLMQKG